VTEHDPLTPTDALLWRIEADPVLRTPIVVVGLLDRAPSWMRVRSSLAAAAEAIPRLRQRIDGGGALGHPAWVEDPTFDVDHHLRRVRAAVPGGVRSVLDLVEPDAAATFDPSRPPWTLTIVEGLDAGKAAFVMRFHHAISDGVGAVDLADVLLDRTRRGGSTAPATEPRPPHARRPKTPFDTALDLASAALDPFATARRSVRFARSAARVLSAAPAPMSPLLSGRSIDRRMHVLEVPLASLQKAAAAAGCTLNDIWLAAAGGALHRYHDKLGVTVDALRLTVPISVRAADDAPGGNRFAPARFVLPVDDPNPVHRARLAGAIVRKWRGEPALRSSAMVAGMLDRLPTPVLVRLFGGMLRGCDADVVDVPGLRRAAFLAGARVDRLWAFSPPGGAALSATLVSHGDTACIGLLSDAAAVEEPELLAECFTAAVDEVLAIHHDAAGRVVA
jgi:WS/DGAT/MGAT family acyltransferase